MENLDYDTMYDVNSTDTVFVMTSFTESLRSLTSNTSTTSTDDSGGGLSTNYITADG